MSALEQKRQEYDLALRSLKAKKLADIERKVEAFKNQLLAEQTHDDELKLQTIINALDQVIKFENETKV